MGLTPSGPSSRRGSAVHRVGTAVPYGDRRAGVPLQRIDLADASLLQQLPGEEWGFESQDYVQELNRTLSLVLRHRVRGGQLTSRCWQGTKDFTLEPDGGGWFPAKDVAALFGVPEWAVLLATPRDTTLSVVLSGVGFLPRTVASTRSRVSERPTASRSSTWKMPGCTFRCHPRT